VAAHEQELQRVFGSRRAGRRGFARDRLLPTTPCHLAAKAVLEPARRGSHDMFYVLDGVLTVQVGTETVQAGPG
jgi:mannose-6-phosphate isomerase-like protein (cupin superfamily)